MSLRFNARLFTTVAVFLVIMATYILQTPPAAYAGSAAIVQVDDSSGSTYTNDAVLGAGQILTVYARVTNNSSTVTLTGVDLTLTGTCSGVASINKGFSAVDISPLGSKIFPVQIIANATVSQSTCTAIKATVSGDTASVNFFFYIGSLPATATPTLTGQPTSTPTISPTPAVPTNCSANTASYTNYYPVQQGLPIKQYLCTVGAMNYYSLPMTRGKVYDLVISNAQSTPFNSNEAIQDGGTLDLVMELYDPNHALVVTSDDSYEPASANSTNLDPYIKQFRAAMDGIYVVRVYEATNTTKGFYTFTLKNLSYTGGDDHRFEGNVPDTSGLCTDLYEPDGLPEQASLIFSNQIQKDHRLCPNGDADWVRFFAKAGNTYVLSTDTTNNLNKSSESTAQGTDTIMTLFDRDAYTYLDQNDNKDTTSFDSRIIFSPAVDGFYFVQIKNIGDLGNPFFQYYLLNTVCPEGAQDCAGTGSQLSPVPTSTPADDFFQPTITPKDGGEYIDPTETTEPDSSTGYERAGYQTTTELINGPLKTFVNRAFEFLWARSDRPVVRQQAQRSWLWGPDGLMARSEAYLQISGGMRQVQYFDKGRMEINNPAADPRNPWFVTSGLLVRELITGQMQVGNADFIDREPSDVGITGDVSDRNGPTYASFGALVGTRSANRIGAYADTRIARNGTVSTYDASGISAARIGYYSATTGHNIPQVFYDYLTSKDIVYVNGRSQRGALMDNWVATMGYPLSEAFWTKTTINGVEQMVMVQPYERRVLTYVPNNPAGWQIEQGNVGRHYYRWRYGVDPSE
ncbi:MAG: hypothetical protein RLY87_2788 [Chloroflexota bacterium]|jgi:hypothetical protein